MNRFIEKLQTKTRMEMMRPPFCIAGELEDSLRGLGLKEGDIDLSSPCDPSVLDSELRDILEGLVVIEAFIRAEIEHHLRWALGKTKIIIDKGNKVGCIESVSKETIWYRTVCDKESQYYGSFAIRGFSPCESCTIIGDREYKILIKRDIYAIYRFSGTSESLKHVECGWPKGYYPYDYLISWFSKTYNYDKPIKERLVFSSYFDDFEMEGRTIRELINEEYPGCFSS